MAISDDPYLWLEDVTGEEALDWVRTRNGVTVEELAGDEFDATESRIREVLDTDARIPYARRRGQFLYNFWRDAEHVRGLWRRTTMDEYRTENPVWDVLLDLDALAGSEDENWVWGGAQVLRPDQRLALVTLSRGGADATVVREFDLDSRTFRAPEDGGFALPEAKTDIGWIDADTVFVGTDFGPGSLTESGYPRITKRWHRGTPLADAETVYEGAAQDISISAWHDRTPGFERDFVQRATDFYNSETYVLDGSALTRILTPTDASTSVHENWLLIRTMTPWTVRDRTYPAGALLAADFDEFVSGTIALTVLFAPDAHTSLHQYAWTENHLLLVTLQDVRTKLHVLTPGAKEWDVSTIDGLSDLTSTEIVGTDAEENGDEYFLSSSGYLTPATLLVGTVGGELEVLKQAPAFFDADGLTVEQFFARSDDGTDIPYFVVRRADSGPGPTLLYGYGGFEISMTPGYSGATGRAWLERGGTYVVANIRGGGEYGPSWHTQVLRAGRHLVHEDFAAVARDLVTRGITTTEQLAAQGGSNGGLLMGIMVTKYPELFGALVCQVPLLDMKRYHLLLTGASWVAEYGNPDDPDEWEFISQYSPYQNVVAASERRYPPILIATSTRDDRVHPGHARKMAARLAELGQDVSYYENIEGGHGGASDNAQLAFKTALTYEFLWRHLARS
ncbi:prolyl oligopeptidase family serine peptidase [Rhodococcus sp. IEGM 1401]|uniref:prolyl oligopeptidase family serine peptidase n=1 Tax=unclassified Rhodococcus (in: high G+C Gram-positive bacteria) TaxID=192944 RepID=UPI0022B2E736|nr:MULTISPECIES: prolyl oligopeptidase family serine peptidase [unclassified Rhodococcus (in: high G+C Gram-positive bacteria)]MCZ4561618.1 prolyl oligopeptidase family serine peptidase [Rhodococcus sp. IEGM 1401]MDI9921762.1 prolyl oligopeptidase family serine peptidase [Rhodococcus sp. IEGM 1372]MDV8034213.1 prolyl oligopeptidase family serine peptidase [Rhodococcus sp. IEGM 1414]